MEICDKDLIKIGREIEHTKTKSGQRSWDREFVWLYTPTLPLERIDIDLPPQMAEWLSASREIPRNTKAVAIVHNHPSGYVYPSPEDITTLLSVFQYNLSLKYGLIASTPLQLRGFLVMEYQGTREEVGDLRAKAINLLNSKTDKRLGEMAKHPAHFSHIRAGDYIFSHQESTNLAIKLMQISKVSYLSFGILPVYRFRNFRFEALP